MSNSKVIRLDKLLTELSVGTRSEVKGMIKKGKITVNGALCKIPETKIQTATDIVALDGRVLQYSEFEYYMLNKPQGVVSATTDNHCETVVDLITGSNRKDLFPVGRLDKDTEGLLLITNDGELAHNLLSPKKHVDKVYYARVKGNVTNEDCHRFIEGLPVDAEFTAMPAKLEILSAGEISEIHLTIKEGKFHQVKRMFTAVEKEVIYLKRISMGSLVLDESLKAGEYRSLTKEEVDALRVSNK